MRDQIWCREHLIEVSYVRTGGITDEDRARGYLWPEQFIGWYWVDPRTGDVVDQDW